MSVVIEMPFYKEVNNVMIEMFMKKTTKVALIDISGSTEGKILESEIKMVKEFGITNVVTWSTEAVEASNTFASQVGVKSDDKGTDPSCLFSNLNVVKAIKTSQVVLFVTDGKVEAREVNKFSRMCGRYFDRASAIICVVVEDGTQKKQSNPAMLDISVFSPLTTFPNVVVLRYDGETYHVMNCTPKLKLQWPLTMTILDDKKWTDIPKITAQEILSYHLQVSENTTSTEEGFNLLPSGNEFNISRMLTITTFIGLDEKGYAVITNNIGAIVIISQNEGYLNLLRKWIDMQLGLAENYTIKQQPNIGVIYADLKSWAEIVKEKSIFQDPQTSISVFSSLSAQSYAVSSSQGSFSSWHMMGSLQPSSQSSLQPISQTNSQPGSLSSY